MDQGQACKRLEISTSSDVLPSQHSGLGHKWPQQKKEMQMEVKDQNEQNREKEQDHDCKSHQSNGHHWSLQAQQWGTAARDEPEQRGHVFKCQSDTESCYPGLEFKLVGRCDVRDETRVCFTHSNFSPRSPFLSPAPPPPTNCRQETLWSRGLLSLGAVTHLRVAVPFGGAASALGLKALAVWGQPARCCPAEEVERIKRTHEASESRPPQPVFFAPHVRQIKQEVQTATPPSKLSIPEEFLDPITQEVMCLPMLLPSGVSVDNTTLEEYNKREATWGRPPNDPFTGVLFTSTSQPLPNPQLKTRIDHFLLQKGEVRRDGMLGRRGKGGDPQASRLIASSVDRQSQNSPCLSKSSINNTSVQYNAGPININRTTLEGTGSGHSSDKGNDQFNSQSSMTDNKLEVDRRKKQDLSRVIKESTDDLTAEKQLLPQTKRLRSDAVSFPSCSSHEQRLSASLDEALFSALQGRPCFTSNLAQQSGVSPDSEPLNRTQHCQSAGTPSMSTGEKTCSACSLSVSVYASSVSSIYRLTCGHLLCHTCLRRESQLNSATSSTSNHVSCATCHSPTPRAKIIRVHY
ncbi:RING finger protein 37 isoform X2 [Mastacembelus armatus]|nr:RING finger protein 37 isoform X2 [Mastacembelus armatus]